MSGDNETVLCTSCHRGLFLVNNTCEICVVGCLNCLSASVCGECNDYFYLDKTSGQC